jgi:hypothetical protein
MFDEHAKGVHGDHRRDRLDELRIDLQRRQYLKV